MYDTKEEAIQAARRVIALLKDDKWTYHVWENLGWHWHFQNGPIFLMEDIINGKSQGFWTMLTTEVQPKFCYGSLTWETTELQPHYDDPNDAVKAQMDSARNILDGLTTVVERGEQINVT